MEQTQTTAIVSADKKFNQLKTFIRSDDIRQRFVEIMGSREASAYISSVVIAVGASNALMECTANSVVTSALRAATLKLSCDPATGQAYIVPFKDHGVPKAQLQVGYKGLLHMAIRTEKYRFVNVGPIREGMEVEENPLTGMHKITGKATSEKVIGYIGYFELYSGYSKSVYWTMEQIYKHAAHYSQAFKSKRQDSPWFTKPEDMEKKTVLKDLLTHWGVLDPHDVLALDALDKDAPEETEPKITIENDRPKRTEKEIMKELGFEEPIEGEVAEQSLGSATTSEQEPLI